MQKTGHDGSIAYLTLEVSEMGIEYVIKTTLRCLGYPIDGSFYLHRSEYMTISNQQIDRLAWIVSAHPVGFRCAFLYDVGGFKSLPTHSQSVTQIQCTSLAARVCWATEAH